MVCTYHAPKAFKEFVTPNGVRDGINIFMLALWVNRLSQKGSHHILPTIGETETGRYHAFKQKLEMTCLGRKQPAVVGPEEILHQLLVLQPRRALLHLSLWLLRLSGRILFANVCLPPTQKEGACFSGDTKENSPAGGKERGSFVSGNT